VENLNVPVMSNAEKQAFNRGLQISIDRLQAEVNRLRQINRAWTKSRITEHLKRIKEIEVRKL
jgi:hypothetical protein